MRYILKRLLLMLPTFLGITFLTYLMVSLAPGDFISLKAGLQGELKEGSVNKEVLDQARKLYVFDNPLLSTLDGWEKGMEKTLGLAGAEAPGVMTRLGCRIAVPAVKFFKIAIGYYEWMKRFLCLDLGKSWKDQRPVKTRIAEALPVTLALNLITIALIYLISIPIGIVSAVRKDSLLDRGTSLILFVLYSLPTFWIGLLLLMIFSGGEYLNLFPLEGIISDWAENLGFWGRLVNVLWHLVLPVVTLTYGSFAFLSRYTRANMLEVINQQYITTARAKGLSEKTVIFKHAFRNSLVPLVTLMATLLPGLLGEASSWNPSSPSRAWACWPSRPYSPGIYRSSWP